MHSKTSTFGAALSGLFLAGAPAVDAVEVNLTFTPGSLAYGAAGTFGIAATTGAAVGSLFQFNGVGGPKGLGTAGAGIQFLKPVSYGNTINTGTFFANYLPYGGSAFGTRILAFETVNDQVGWIRLDLGGAGNPISYLDGVWNDTPGASIIAGKPIPEPSTTALAALAALAMGARRRRKAAN